MIKFLGDVWTLIRRKSRTMLAALGTALMILADQFNEVKSLLLQAGVRPSWLALIGIAVIIYARRDDFSSGRNPQ